MINKQAGLDHCPLRHSSVHLEPRDAVCACKQPASQLQRLLYQRFAHKRLRDDFIALKLPEPDDIPSFLSVFLLRERV